MDYQKFTEKSMSAIYSAEQSAREYGNPEIKQAHLLYALLTQENGLIPEVLKGVEIDVERMTSDVLALLEKLPKVRGQSGKTSGIDERRFRFRGAFNFGNSHKSGRRNKSRFKKVRRK